MYKSFQSNSLKYLWYYLIFESIYEFLILVVIYYLFVPIKLAAFINANRRFSMSSFLL